MKQKNNVVKLNAPSRISDDALTLLNLQQVLDAVVRKHGAHVTLQVLPSMVQASQTKVRNETKLPVSKRDKGVSNG